MDHRESPTSSPADLVSALEVIEAQPLRTRAVAYEALNEALARRLESGPSASRP